MDKYSGQKHAGQSNCDMDDSIMLDINSNVSYLIHDSYTIALFDRIDMLEGMQKYHVSMIPE